MNGNLARANSRSLHGSGSTQNGNKSFTVPRAQELNFSATQQIDDAAHIRAALVEAIRESGKSREQIADEMTALAGRKVSLRMLNGYTAESQEDYIFPAELTRAFCIATNSFLLLEAMADVLHFQLISKDESELLELGRAYLQREQAEEQMSLLQRRLHGRSL